MKKLALYIHIPFCKSKCIYCAFCSFVAKKEQIKKYFKALGKEIEEKSAKCKDYEVSSIFIGGGTPSSVDGSYIKKIIDLIRKKYNVSNNAEISIECNPNSATKNLLKFYKDMGINRISFGVQSLFDDELKFLNRCHNRLDAINVINEAKNIGFKHINADLLIGLGTQTIDRFKEQILTLTDCGVDHLSCYMLQVEDGTTLQKIVQNENVLLDEDACVDLYQEIINTLKEQGFNQYEVSNFAKNNGECKHNMSYWDLTEYLGFGLAAHSYFNGYRLENTSNFDDYVAGKYQIQEHKQTIDEEREEFVMLGLRTKNGINLAEYKNRFGMDLYEEKKNEIKELVNLDMISINNDVLKVNQQYFGCLNSIIIKLL